MNAIANLMNIETSKCSSHNFKTKIFLLTNGLMAPLAC